MSGYQFIHVECYGREAGKGKAGAHNLASIAAEAERVAGACKHVAHPQMPVILHGCSPSAATEMADDWAMQAKDAKGRKLRKDGLCLLSGIVSLPKSREADWPKFRDASINWLKNKYGESLQSVVEHRDEEHPHIHFYVVPLVGERFETVHEGRMAAQNEKNLGKLKGVQNSAYMSAMKNWQTDFFEAVAAGFGLARLGPEKRRLTRKEWRIEQDLSVARAKRDALLKIQIDNVRNQLSHANEVLQLFTAEEIEASRMRRQRKQNEPELSSRLLGLRERMGLGRNSILTSRTISTASEHLDCQKNNNLDSECSDEVDYSQKPRGQQ